MDNTIQKLLLEKNVLMHRNEGILVVKAVDATEGLELANTLLHAIVDRKTALFLSGGKTPLDLYYAIATEGELQPGVVGLVDERYGPKMYEQSNERAMKNTGLLRYLSLRDIPFYPILQDGMTRRDSAQKYDQDVRSLLATFPRTITVLGIGLDGHTAGIAGNRQDFSNPIFDPGQKTDYVSDFNDEKGMFKERITMTFLGLTMLDLHLVLVFGQSKKRALDLLFENGSVEEVPARFFKKPDIAQKTLLITDQNI